MGYSVGQFNQSRAVGDNIFSEYITAGAAEVREAGIDMNVSDDSSEGYNFTFSDPFLHLTGGSLQEGSNYYFHGKIKRLNTVQNFNIRLFSTDSTNTIKQYIKPLEIKAAVDADSTKNYQVDVEFVFTPFATGFDGILFELVRNEYDFALTDNKKIIGRTPVIGYIELSKLNNIISSSQAMGINSNLLKIGIQSRPGLMTCINGEEIHLPRSGVFELRDGIVPISFFSVVSASAPAATESDPSATQLNDQMDTATASACFLSSTYGKKKTIDSFTIDYLYSI